MTRLVAIALPLLAIGCSAEQMQATAPPAPVSAGQETSATTAPRSPGAQHTAPKRSVDPGERIYGAYCASCHGPTAQGDGPLAKTLTPRPANLTQRRRGPHKSGKTRWEIILNGSDGTAMQAFSKILTPKQLTDLHGHLRQLLHKGNRGGHGNGSPCGGACDSRSAGGGEPGGGCGHGPG